MKLDQIPTRRKPVQKTVYARLFNRTKFHKQRASATAAAPEEFDDSNSNISRSLSIIFAIHILAIGMIFIHKQYLSGRTAAPVVENQQQADPAPRVVSPERADPITELSSGDKPYMVRKGDNYAVIATKFQVDEAELRKLNRGADIKAGTVLRIPEAKRIVAVDPPEVEAIRNQAPANQSEQGLVEILPVNQGAQPATHAPNQIPTAVPVGASGKTHKVQPGESVWRIAKQHNLTEKELMSLNGISDPTKLKAGQVLKLP